MGSIVFGAAISHAPHITGSVAAGDSQQVERFYQAAAVLRDTLRRARPDVLVVIASDHLTNFFTTCIPAFCLGRAEVFRGPVEQWIKVPEFTVPGAAPFANALLARAAPAGIDFAFSDHLPLEHGVAVPLALLTPNYDVPIVPLIQNCMVPPLPTLARCYRVGELIRDCAQASDLRVAVLGTGGLSHWPGAPESGDIDTDFDNEFLARIASDSPRQILEFSNERLDRAGFGSWEVRQWATALGACGGARAKVLAYEAMHAWETGCAAVLFDTGGVQT